MTWKVVSGSAVVEQNGTTVLVNREAKALLEKDGRTVFSDVSFPPLVDYTSKGIGDVTAAYLNAALYLPNAIVEGVPPYELITDDAVADKNATDTVEAKMLPRPYRRPRALGEDMNTGGMIALIPTPESAANLVVAGGDPVSELHLTLFFISDGLLYNEAQRDVIRSIVQMALTDMYMPPEGLTANVVGAGVLGEQGAKVYIIGDAFRLVSMFEGVQRSMGNAIEFVRTEYQAQRSPWIAHVTAGYNEFLKIEDLKYRGPVTFDRVRVAFGDTYTDFPIEGQRDLPDDYREWLNNNEDTEPAQSMKDLFDGMPPDLVLAAKNLTPEEIAEEAFGEKTGSKNPNAARLRAYWTRGAGAPRIRWGVSGDFMRCVNHMRKYVADPKGTCANYHHTALGVWPGREKIDPLSLTWADSETLTAIKRLTLGTANHPDSLVDNETEGAS